MTTYSSIFAWKNPIDRGAWQGTVQGIAKMSDKLSNYNHNNHIHTAKLKVEILSKQFVFFFSPPMSTY